MKHKDIQRLIDPIEVTNLTKDNFQNFSKNVVGLFMQKNAKFKHYISPGYGAANLKLLDEKPGWRYKASLTLKSIDKWEDDLIVNFNGGRWSTIVGCMDPPIHFLFGFDSDKAMYLAHQQNVHWENKIGLWEDLYIKLD
jgi:hypothetical protein